MVAIILLPGTTPTTELSENSVPTPTLPPLKFIPVIPKRSLPSIITDVLPTPELGVKLEMDGLPIPGLNSTIEGYCLG